MIFTRKFVIGGHTLPKNTIFGFIFLPDEFEADRGTSQQF